MSPLSVLSPEIVATHRDKVMGCWLGKAVGGTLGMPFEGQDGPLDLAYYSPVPTGMLPNDDLDLQVVWACALSAMERPCVDRELFARAWQDHVEFPWDEYGVAKRNLTLGLKPPHTGRYDNWFAHGMGATIRSEVWACLAPGDPALAAAFAYEDACVDHADEGIHGEVFFAALQSLAFTESHPDRLLDGASGTLPEESSVRRAIADTRIWWDEFRDWRAVRERILEVHGHENFTDVTMNAAFTVLGWLAGEGDFGRSICIAVNCGKDTDCTGATVGALMGILDPGCISEDWLAPIGRDLVLSPGIVGLDAPATLDEFTEMILSLRDRVVAPEPNGHLAPATAGLPSILAIAWPLTAMPEAVPAAKSSARTLQFSGTAASLAANEFEDEYLSLAFTFQIEQTGPVQLMFNTGQACRVWVNGGLLFESQGEDMAPSFHRVPAGQSAIVALARGQHLLTVVLRRPSAGGRAEWVVGAGDPVTKQWIARAFHGGTEHGHSANPAVLCLSR